MKKVLLVGLLLLLVLVTLIACTDPVVTTEDPAVTTTTDPEDTPRVTTGNNDQVIPGELAEGQDYIAVENTAKWEKDPVDTSKFTYFGSGISVISEIDQDLAGYTKTYYISDGTTKTEAKRTDVRKLGMVGVAVENKNASAKTVDLVASEVNVRALASWSSVTARAGSYLTFEFTTNMPMDFYMTVTPKEGGSQSTAAYKQAGVTVSGSNGTYKGIAKCTVPYSPGKTYYINICVDATGYPVVASVPVEIKTAKYDSEYSLMFQGDWELIKDKEYLPNLIDLFYNVYPRLYARFSLDEYDKKAEPKVITFMADKNYDGVAYCAGTTVCVSVDYANGHPTDLGFFSHEITHSVQQYGALKNYGGTNSWTDPATGKTIVCNSWWTENMANYGGFRYFHWGYSTKFVQIYDVNKQSSLWNWNWEPYGDGSKLFLSYLDQKFPSIDENKNGKLEVSEFGVIDMVNYNIKMATSQFSDHPYDPNSPFNQAVKAGTDGKFNTMEEVRQQYEKDCRSGAWKFIGFGDCVDNWVTENLPGIPNPNYPMWREATPGDKTAAALANPVLSGTNILKGATIKDFSSEVSRNPVDNIIDGDLTKDSLWQSQSASSAADKKYQLQGFDQGFVIDLGSVKTFDTYTVVSRGYISDVKTHNLNEWEILVSEDGINWTSVDYQKYVDGTTRVASPDAVSFNIGDVKARYIEMRIYTTDKGNTGVARLVEFMAFDN